VDALEPTIVSGIKSWRRLCGLLPVSAGIKEVSISIGVVFSLVDQLSSDAVDMVTCGYVTFSTLRARAVLLPPSSPLALGLEDVREAGTAQLWEAHGPPSDVISLDLVSFDHCGKSPRRR
jgi:hypothetical protein